MYNITRCYPTAQEIDEIAYFIAEGYNDDAFFHWVVPPAEERLAVVAAYYAAYLRAAPTVLTLAAGQRPTVLASKSYKKDVNA